MRAIVVGGLQAMSACGPDVAEDDIRGQTQELVKQLGERHTLVFEASADIVSVIESAPLGTPVVLPTLEDQRPDAVLQRYFPGSKLFGDLDQQDVNQPVQAQVQAISREDFLAGDKICSHKCATAPHTLNPPYPYEWGESCILDAQGGLETPALEGEVFFWTANSRTEAGVVEVTRTLYPTNPDLNPYTEKKSVALPAGEVKYASMRRTKSPDILGARVQVKVTGVTGALYDAYTCSAASDPVPTPPAPDPCGPYGCVTW